MESILAGGILTGLWTLFSMERWRIAGTFFFFFLCSWWCRCVLITTVCCRVGWGKAGFVVCIWAAGTKRKKSGTHSGTVCVKDIGVYISAALLVTVHWPVLCRQKWLYFCCSTLFWRMVCQWFSFFPCSKEKKKAFAPFQTPFFLCYVVFKSWEFGLDRWYLFCWCYVEIADVEGLCIWKIFVCAGSTAIIFTAG